MEPSPYKKENSKKEKPIVFGLPKHREKVIEAIGEAYANNNLDIEEYEKRLEQAHDAKSLNELRQVVHDFPQVNTLVPLPKEPSFSQPKNKIPSYNRLMGQPEYRPSPAETFRQSVEGVDFLNVIGDRRITSLEINKPEIKGITIIGDSIIDLRDISNKFTQIRIENYCAIGNLKIRVPHNAQVSKNMMILIGDSKKRTIGKSLIKRFLGIKREQDKQYDPNQAPIFVEVSGFKLIGDLIIEYMPEPGMSEYY